MYIYISWGDNVIKCDNFQESVYFVFRNLAWTQRPNYWYNGAYASPVSHLQLITDIINITIVKVIIV